MMSAPTIVRPTKGDGYPIWVADTARAMHAEGKSSPAIARALTARGVIGITPQTILEWTNEEFRQRRRDINAAWHARESVKRNGGRISPRSNRPEYVQGRVVALAEKCGLTVDQIEAVVALDFGESPDQTRIRLALHEAGLVAAEHPGAKPRTIIELTCHACGATFNHTTGCQGRPPTYCPEHRTSTRRKAVSRQRKAVTAVANGADAPTTNPTERPS